MQCVSNDTEIFLWKDYKHILYNLLKNIQYLVHFGKVPMMRDMLFLSHANPEDNEFTLWLALQLAREGYPVWCDLTKLLGGEDIWKKAEQTIRERAQKFIYILSKTSNQKQGPLQELQVAQNVAREQNLNDFIIPLLIDGLPHREINIQLTRTYDTPFNNGWANGLKILLEKLEKDGVSKSPKFTPHVVTSWWRQQFSANQGVSDKSDEYLSNWFPIHSLPQNIYFHELRGWGNDKIQDTYRYPAFPHNQYLVSFARADDFVGEFGNFSSIGNSHPISIEDFLNEKLPPRFITDRKQARDFISRLLRMAWEKMVKDRRFPTYDMANEAKIFYFSKGLVENDRISFTSMNNKPTFRNVVGYKSRKNKDSQVLSKSFWHFSIQSKPITYPFFAYVIKPHVVFSDDGINVWKSKEKLHRARRRWCKSWWNPDWRDRILATMFWLAHGKEEIEIKVGKDVAIKVSTQPLTFTSPVSYSDPERSEPQIFDKIDEDIELEEIESEDED